MDIKILKDLFQLTIERGNPLKRQDQTVLRIMVYPGLLKCGKVELQSTIDRGNLRIILGIHCKKLTLIVEYLLGRNAHSARYGETIHDGWEKPEKVNHQEQAYFENFVMGSDATEFVNKVRDQVRNRQKNVEHCRGLYRTFDNLGNVHGYNIECCDIYGKEFLNYSKCCQES